ncbi:polysaccharide deacetylase family protein [Planctomicrobium sp. SH661]|uniref:polysaccharide deacetylase family protein n=1 Tax=Planctomicrobium sp. SH661 TaxID=3448124 RepID=UPI003F5C6F3E
MKPFYFCFSVDDIGMEEWSTPAHVERILEVCDELGMKSTLFTVPRPFGKPFPIREYKSVLEAADQGGHEIGQHGLEHDRFEMGIPPRMILDLPHEGPAREYLANHPDEVAASLAVERIRERLKAGRELLQQDLGVSVEGSRSPCASTCDNLYTALKAEGYRYDSSTILQPAAWAMIVRAPNPQRAEITQIHHDSIRDEDGFCVYPIAAEYTWFPQHDQFDDYLSLAKGDFDSCLKHDIPFVPVAHVSPIQSGQDSELGFELYRELVGYARQAAAASGRELVFTTLSGLHAARDAELVG